MVIIKHKYYGTQTKPFIWIWWNASLEVWTHALWSSKNHTLNKKSTPLTELFLWNFQIHKTARNIINVEILKCTKHWCSFWRQNKTNKTRAIPGSGGSACLRHCHRLVAWRRKCSSFFVEQTFSRLADLGRKQLWMRMAVPDLQFLWSIEECFGYGTGNSLALESGFSNPSSK